MEKTDALAELVSGFDAFVEDSDALSIDATSDAPAATTTFCAFTVSYTFTRLTLKDGC